MNVRMMTMTYKEAVDQLKDLIQDRQSMISNDEVYSDIYKQDIDALQIGINAIEQPEQGKIAHWDINCSGFYPFCSNCKRTPKAHDLTRYCPYCGAKMMTRDDDNDES